MYYYVSGTMGMKANGSFTRDRSRWIVFAETDVVRYSERGITPYGATRRGTFVPTARY